MKTTAKLTIKIVQDEYPLSPSEDGDENLFLVYEHRSFSVDRKHFNPREIYEKISSTKKVEYADFFVFTVFAYIHSGVALSLSREGYPFNDQWDVSSTGFILASKKEFKKREKAYKAAEGLIEYWNNYLSGNVYGYEIVNEEGEVYESCYGYFGDEDESGVKEDAQSALTRLQEEQKEQFELEMESSQPQKIV